MYSRAARLVREATGAGMAAADEEEMAGGEERGSTRVGGGEKPEEKRVRVGRAAERLHLEARIHVARWQRGRSGKKRMMVLSQL